MISQMESPFVCEDAQTGSDTISQTGELETLHYMKQELGGGSKAESFARWRGCVLLPAREVHKSGVDAAKHSASLGAEAARGG